MGGKKNVIGGIYRIYFIYQTKPKKKTFKEAYTEMSDFE